MRSTFVRTAAYAALLALAGAGAAMAPLGVDTTSTPTGPDRVTALAATGTSSFLTTPNPTSSLTCPGEVIWRAAPRARAPRHHRPAPPPPPVPGGPTGRIEGRVTYKKSGELLNDAVVTVVGTAIQTLTNMAGNYSLPDVPAGERTVKVVILGYASQEKQVTVTAGQATVADFALEEQPLNLSEVVVTGVGKVERRKIGVALPSTGVGAGRELRVRRDINTESYARIDENDFRLVGSSPLSTFSIDVDRASYANVRRFIQEGRRPPVDAVRIEEMINYFNYERGDISGEHPFAVTTEVAQAPWKREHRLVRIGLHAPSVDSRHLPPGNLVFLLDVSGSMGEPNKLPLLQSAFALLADQLRPEDRVTVMTYSSVVCLALPSTSGNRKDEILATIERLQAGGGTAGGPALQAAYDIARQHHIEGGNNRIILATDGDFNVGPASDEAMVELVERERAAGTHLTVLGFGTGNLKDSKMEQIADNGNGNFHYVDGLLEARKVLIEEMGGTILTLAKDVKLQVEFNWRGSPATA